MSEEKIVKNQTLVENSEFSAKLKLSKALKESVKLSQSKNGTLIVRNVPCTILNRRNQNGRIYPTEVMERAIQEARPLIEAKQLLSKPNEHPENSFIAPSEASHVIIDAYIKKNVSLVVEGKRGRFDVLFMDWEVLNTQNGKDLRALLEAECSVGTSIRGVGDLNGDTVENYTLLGVDIVGNPSSSTFTRMPISESVRVELASENSLKEGFTVSSSSTDVTRDLESATQLANKINQIDVATLTNTSTKSESELDPKTGAVTNLITLETETSDDVADIDQALMMAKRIMLNGTTHVDSVTIENIPEEEETQKESVADPEEYIPENEINGLMPENTNTQEENIMTEAKEEEIDPNIGKKFVLKAPAGFVAMDGNALVFKDDPKEALHFVVGKEESGLVHLSGVEKILDTMGVYDVEKYYRKPENEIKGGEEKPVEEGIAGSILGGAAGAVVGHPILGAAAGSLAQDVISDSTQLKEENGSNTKFIAEVHTRKANGTDDIENNISVSSVDLNSALREISNLWEMKTKKNEGDVTIYLVDTVDNLKYIYNSQKNSLDLYDNNMNNKPVEEASVTQDNNKLTVNVDDDTSIEKEFEDPAQASVVKAGLEQGKLTGDIMLSEDGDSILSGWYVANDKIGITGPFETKEEAEEEFKDFLDEVSIEYLSNDNEENVEEPQIESGWYAGAENIGVVGPFESREDAEEEFKDFLDKVFIEYLSNEETNDEENLNEVLFNKPSAPSDDYIKEPTEEN